MKRFILMTVSSIILLACSSDEPSRFDTLFNTARTQHRDAMEALVQAGKEMIAASEGDRELIKLSKRKPLTQETREKMNTIMANGKAISQRAVEAGENALENNRGQTTVFD